MKLRKIRLLVLLCNALSLSYITTSVILAFIIPNTVITLSRLVSFSLFFLALVLSTKILNDYEKYDRTLKAFKSIKKEK